VSDLLSLSAQQLAAKIRGGEASAVDVVEAHIARIEEVEPAVHAVAVERFAAARKEAQAADAQVADGGELPPLLGVPFTVQEGIAVEGMPHSAGRAARASVIAQRDATAVARLRGAGGIVLAVTNVAESALGLSTESSNYGRTDNPYDSRCMAGSGAGGEAALVGAGASPFGVGADVNGGIRVPAFFCGTYAHKATAGTVPVTGVHPLPGGEADRFVGVGPLTRHAEDLLFLLRIMAGPDGEDGSCVAGSLGADLELDPTTISVLDIPEDGVHEIRDDLRVCQQVCVNLLVEHGAAFKFQRFSALERSFEIWSAAIDAAAGLGLTGMLGDGSRRKEGMGQVGRLASSNLPGFLMVARERLSTLTPGHAGRLGRQLETMRSEMLDAMGDDGVMMLPAMNVPAPRHGRSGFKSMGWTQAAIFNVLGFPVTQIPVGFDPTGLPMGTQVIAAPGNDHLTIAVARYLESRARNWRIS